MNVLYVSDSDTVSGAEIVMLQYLQHFRPPEHLKARIEEAAGREGLSVNAWLVRAVNGVLGTAEKRPESRRSSSPQSFTGWVR